MSQCGIARWREVRAKAQITERCAPSVRVRRVDDFDSRDKLWPRIRTPNHELRVVGPVMAAYHAARHRIDGAAREHGLDSTEVVVLEAILRDLRCAPWSIRRRLGLPASTLHSVLDRLERSGHLDRSGAPLTQRFALDLTTSGRIAADLAAYVLGAFEEELRGYTSKEERAGAIAVFEACMALDRPDRPHR